MQDHIPYLSLSEIGHEYCLATYNDRHKYFANIMVHLKWIYKDLLLKSIFQPKLTYVKVDKTTNPLSIVVPADMLRFLNLCTEDVDGSLRSFVFDETINDTPLPTGINACHVCNEEDSYGQCFNNLSAITKTVEIDGEPYTEKIWKQLCPNGDVLEIREIPTVDFNEADEQIVVTVKKERIIANLEMKPCGCVKKTKQNLDCINLHCGVLINSNQIRMANPTLYKVGTKTGRMKISQGRIWLAGRVPDWMILIYQTNGVCGENEIMVPEYAVNALIFGAKWRSVALSGIQSPEMARINYEREVQAMDEFLNPIRVEEFMNVQMALPKWGSEIDQSCINHGFWSDCQDIPKLEDCE